MTFTERVIAYFVERPGVWIATRDLEQFGRQAWRTRVSEARVAFRVSGEGDIENRVRTIRGHADTCPALLAWDIHDACSCGQSKRWTLSEYRFVPAPKPTAAERERELHNQNADWGLR